MVRVAQEERRADQRRDRPADALGDLVLGENLQPLGRHPQQSQLAFLTRATIRGIQNTFVQRRRGMVSADMWRGYEILLRRQIRLGVVRDWWPDEGETFESDFRELVEQLLDRDEP